jgi:alkylhydroperoxidase family enzyme
MRTGRPAAKIELSSEIAGILEGYTQRRKTAQALALRARIVLGCAAGMSNKAAAARERVTAQTVGKWRRRFVERGLDGRLDEPRPGAPRKIDDAKIENVMLRLYRTDGVGCLNRLAIVCGDAAMSFSFASGSASRKVCIGVCAVTRRRFSRSYGATDAVPLRFRFAKHELTETGMSTSALAPAAKTRLPRFLSGLN